MVIRLNGRITETGELEMELPSGLPSGEAQITIEIPADASRDALRTEPMTGEEIVRAGLLGGWKDEGITDSSAWVEELRQKRRASRPW